MSSATDPSFWGLELQDLRLRKGNGMAPLLGLVSLLCACFFLVVLPVIVAVLAWQDRRVKKLSAGLLTAVVMLVVFFTSAVLLWSLGTADWKLSFLTTLEASVNAEKYGPIESRAERIVVWLLIYSTMAAGLAGAATASASSHRHAPPRPSARTPTE
jgi:hypothetical protein